MTLPRSVADVLSDHVVFELESIDRQAQVPDVRGLSQPCPYHAVDLAPAGFRMLAVYPLPVQPDAEIVHVQGSLQPRRFRSRVLCCRAACTCAPSARARKDCPECARGAPDFSRHRALRRPWRVPPARP